MPIGSQRLLVLADGNKYDHMLYIRSSIFSVVSLEFTSVWLFTLWKNLTCVFVVEITDLSSKLSGHWQQLLCWQLIFYLILARARTIVSVVHEEVIRIVHKFIEHIIGGLVHLLCGLSAKWSWYCICALLNFIVNYDVIWLYSLTHFLLSHFLFQRAIQLRLKLICLTSIITSRNLRRCRPQHRVLRLCYLVIFRPCVHRRIFMSVCWPIVKHTNKEACKVC